MDIGGCRVALVTEKLCLSILNNVAQAKQHQFSNLYFENSRIREKDSFYLYSHLLRKRSLGYLYQEKLH